jgi:2-isopropylmalate synthase
MPVAKYRPFQETNGVHLPDRTWPDKQVTVAPRWLSTDLRDGNQALIEPMSPTQKRAMFDLLVSMGYKEIEIGFPAASQADHDFVRSLVEEEAVPEDVTVSVLTQARPELIQRTIESLVGFPQATVHLYNATAPVFRNVVFRNDRDATRELAVAGTREVVAHAEKVLGDETIFGYQYSPEIFVDTELDFALEVCEAVMGVWQPDGDREIILNLPATIERATPNVYADQIEWMSRNLSNRENVVLSVHPHNDRGSGVAAAELAMLAGADRVEGCLFGQGERTGNVDLVTHGMNLYSQGVDPMIDFSDIDGVRRTVEQCTQMDVHPRHPYGGDLVYTSFSGSHQDAIKKGFAVRDDEVAAAGGDDAAVVWNLPYLPVDPKDVGRTYEAVVRVNSQSGKGGVAYLLQSTRNLDLPRRLQIEVAGLVQKHTDAYGGEIDAERLWRIFADEYLPHTEADGLTPWGRFELRSTSFTSSGEGQDSDLTVVLVDGGEEKLLSGRGNGPIDAFVKALATIDVGVEVLDYAEHALSSGEDAAAAAYLEVETGEQVVWGVGIDPSTMTASFEAIISAVNRAARA